MLVVVQTLWGWQTECGSRPSAQSVAWPAESGEHACRRRTRLPMTQWTIQHTMNRLCRGKRVSARACGRAEAREVQQHAAPLRQERTRKLIYRAAHI